MYFLNIEMSDEWCLKDSLPHLFQALRLDDVEDLFGGHGGVWEVLQDLTRDTCLGSVNQQTKKKITYSSTRPRATP